jgi:glucose-6-phosphate isomerase
VGGRFSVLTGVGLLPAAAAGCDVRALLAGAGEMQELLRAPGNDTTDNPALKYAALRQAAYRAGRKVEALLYCTPALSSLAEWWKQLFGESEGKQGQGLLPTSIGLTTDLHSLGQWLQDGEPIALETAIDAVGGDAIEIPDDPARPDRPDRLAGRPLHEVNRVALAATLEAHAAGGTPCARIQVPAITEPTLGGLLYFFEYACAVSAYVQGVNPFDQPGVEHYKRNMRRLLGSG